MLHSVSSAKRWPSVLFSLTVCSEQSNSIQSIHSFFYKYLQRYELFMVYTNFIGLMSWYQYCTYQLMQLMRMCHKMKKCFPKQWITTSMIYTAASDTGKRPCDANSCYFIHSHLFMIIHNILVLTVILGGENG